MWRDRGKTGTLVFRFERGRQLYHFACCLRPTCCAVVSSAASCASAAFCATRMLHAHPPTPLLCPPWPLLPPPPGTVLLQDFSKGKPTSEELAAWARQDTALGPAPEVQQPSCAQAAAVAVAAAGAGVAGLSLGSPPGDGSDTAGSRDVAARKQEGRQQLQQQGAGKASKFWETAPVPLEGA
jgi:hypothetical protein